MVYRLHGDFSYYVHYTLFLESISLLAEKNKSKLTEQQVELHRTMIVLIQKVTLFNNNSGFCFDTLCTIIYATEYCVYMLSQCWKSYSACMQTKYKVIISLYINSLNIFLLHSLLCSYSEHLKAINQVNWIPKHWNLYDKSEPPILLKFKLNPSLL